ncbi:DUF3828 domain-containing protein [Burkholderia multivorans]
MNRLLSLVLAFELVFFASWAPAASAASGRDTPEATATAFYTWFIENDTDQTYPLRQRAIEQYVSKNTVVRLREDYSRGGPPNGMDYFLKVQDYDGSDWLAHIAVHPAVMLGGVAVVPVTFGSKDKVDVLVFMKRQDRIWKITKVEDASDCR